MLVVQMTTVYGFSTSEPKAKVHYCDDALSVVRPSSLKFHIFDFFSETPQRKLTILDRKQEPNILYQVCVVRANWKKQDGDPGP